MAIMAELQENLTNMAIFETAASLNELNDSSIRKPYRLKRIFDAVFSLFMIILLSPLYLLIACVIKLTSLNEPVIFKQRRIGYKGKEFICYKFRTMVPDAEKHLEIILEKKPKLKEQFNKEFKLKKDSRIIPLI